MDDVGPFTLFVWFLKTLPGFVVVVWAMLWLIRRKAGGLDLRDWIVLVVAFGVSLVALFVANNLQARYLEQVGAKAEGVLTRKWHVEGDESTTYKVAVQHQNHEGEFEVSEAYWETAQPMTKVPVVYDPEFAADFVPMVAIEESPSLNLCLGMVGLAGFVLLLTLFWTMIRLVERFRRTAA
jgi:hypothetical protein